MWQQILAICWAQIRISRNHLPRTSFGSVLTWTLSALWYALFIAVAILIARVIPVVEIGELRRWLPVGLLGIFLYLQTMPLLTLSSGWSLQLNKLQIYPISSEALFGIEVLLRVTSAPEMLTLLLGGIAGLALRHDVPLFAPLLLLLFVPFSLLLQLAIRDMILYAFERHRFRELFIILIVSIAVLPQVLIRARLVNTVKPYFFLAAQGVVAPWHEVSMLGLGSFSLLDLFGILAWTAVAYAAARSQFQRSLLRDDSFRGIPGLQTKRKRGSFAPFEWIAGSFRDPVGALMQKEFRTLLRMPRFRVIFGMACIFGVIVFVPMALRGRNTFMSDNFVPVVNLYGLLLLSDALLLNVFGFDRGAAQLYFVTPIPLPAVFKAKNLTAASLIVLQTAAVTLFAMLFRVRVSAMSIASGIASSAVVAIFLLSAGNLLSVNMPRPIDPTSAFKKQAGGKMQLWLLGCTIGMFLLVGFAFLARWATQKDWAFLAVLGFEFVIGLIVYRIARESAVEVGLRDRERIVDALSRTGSPVSLG